MQNIEHQTELHERTSQELSFEKVTHTQYGVILTSDLLNEVWTVGVKISILYLISICSKLVSSVFGMFFE